MTRHKDGIYPTRRPISMYLTATKWIMQHLVGSLCFLLPTEARWKARIFAVFLITDEMVYTSLELFERQISTAALPSNIVQRKSLSPL